MSGFFRAAAIFMLVLSACGREPRRTADSAGGAAARSSTDSMAGMDHSKMAMPPSDSMAGMDHSKMPGMSSSRTPAAAMGTMDHSKMAGMTQTKSPATGMAGMDHSKMAGMAPTKTSAADMTPMDHAGMTAKSDADQKIDLLIAALLRDPVVKQRIAQDSALRRGWEQAAVRGTLMARPQ